MFKPKTPAPKTQLDLAIDSVFDDLKTYDSDSKQYRAMVKNLKELHALREDPKSDSRRVSPDTLAIIGANLLGILIIVGYEQKHVVTTKALSFVQKLH